MKFGILVSFRKSVQKIQVSLKSDKNNGYFTWRPIYIFYHISLSPSQNEKCYKDVEKIKTHFVFSNIFPPRKSCCLWDNIEKYSTARQVTDDNIIWRVRFACWIPKATNTHSQYVILIAFPRKQWLRERAWILRYTYIACLVELLFYSFILDVQRFPSFGENGEISAYGAKV
jgi:hypothetical protein